ncbi:MAG: hypothetical protein AAGU75_04285 [Bacillota bacterium]
MKKFTIIQAKSLIKRELGISAAALEKTPSMNSNPQYPWYSMETGKLTIEVYTNNYWVGKIIALHLTFGNGLGSVQRYFYADTLEEAPEFTEKRRWEDICDLTEEKSREQLAAMVNRLSKTAQQACRKHFNA